MAASTIKCPSCGSHLAFTPGTRAITCPYCGTAVSEDEFLREQLQAETAAAPASSMDAGQAEMSDGASLRSYHCSNCGAEIVTGDTTAATSCYYCHSPVVLSDRLSSEYKPDGVIPFALDKQEAEKKFTAYLKSKWFVDRQFFSSASLTHFSGVYYPYWVADVQGRVSFEGEGTIVSTQRGHNEDIVTTRYYHVARDGDFSAQNMVRKALKSANRQLSDGIHPYRSQETKPYVPAYLSGFLAERRDVEKQDVQGEMEQEASSLARYAIRQSAAGRYTSLTGRGVFRQERTDMKYVLMPAWTLTYKGAGSEVYYYMMNGQTGSVCGKLPIKHGKLWAAGMAAGGVVTALLVLGGMLLW